MYRLNFCKSVVYRGIGKGVSKPTTFLPLLWYGRGNGATCSVLAILAWCYIILSSLGHKYNTSPHYCCKKVVYKHGTASQRRCLSTHNKFNFSATGFGITHAYKGTHFSVRVYDYLLADARVIYLILLCLCEILFNICCPLFNI